MNEILIRIKGVGFIFLLDKRMKHNLICPALLGFFSFLKEPKVSLINGNTEEVDTKPNNDIKHPLDNEIPFCFEDIFHYVGKKVILCKDNKLRRCRAFRMSFEYEERPITLKIKCDEKTYSELFYIDQSLCFYCNPKHQISGILGTDFLNRHKWVIGFQNSEKNSYETGTRKLALQ